jgi:hypothetical protein
MRWVCTGPANAPWRTSTCWCARLDAERTAAMLRSLGFRESSTSWKEREFTPQGNGVLAALGEHADNHIKIELHERIGEKLPFRITTVTERIFPVMPCAGLNDYPSRAALMLHLLFHAAGAIAHRSLRLLHLHDLALLGSRLEAKEWEEVFESGSSEPLWWALPPLRLTSRYYEFRIPAYVLARASQDCPRVLTKLTAAHSLTDVSYSPVCESTRFRESSGRNPSRWLSSMSGTAVGRLPSTSPGASMRNLPVGRRAPSGPPCRRDAAFSGGSDPARCARRPCTRCARPSRHGNECGTSAPAADPFGESAVAKFSLRLQLLGANILFESNSGHLLRLVKAAYAGLPGHRLPGLAPRLRIRLHLAPAQRARGRREPAPLTMMGGLGLLGATTGATNTVIVSPQQRAALVVVTPAMLKNPYLLRYEIIEFAVLTLATRVQSLVPLHAACFGQGDRGVLLMGDSGAGKSTLALQALLRDWDFVSEDAVFVAPETMHATGAANFLHIRANTSALGGARRYGDAYPEARRSSRGAAACVSSKWIYAKFVAGRPRVL